MNGKHYYVTVDGDYICVEDNNTDFNLATWNNGVIEVEDFDYPSSAYQSGATSIAAGAAGYGSISSLTLGDIAYSLGVECASHGDGNSYNSSGAQSLSGDVTYYATWTSDSDDTYKYIYWTIYFYNDSLSNRTWSPKQVSYTVTERAPGETPHYKAWYQNGPGGSSTTTYGDTAEAAVEALYSATKRAYGGEYSGFRNFKNTFQHSSSAPGGAGHINFETCSQKQVFYAKVGAKAKNSVYLNVKKSTDSAYSNIVNNNSNYSLAGTTFDVYYDGHIQNDKNGNHTITIDADGNSNTLELNSDWAGYTLQLRETQAGKGYKLLSSDIDVTLGKPGSTTTKEISNTPIIDPALIQLQKNSDLTKSADFNGTINPNGAIYTITQYMGAVSGTSGPVTTNEGRTWTYTTSTIGGVAGRINASNTPTTGTPYAIEGVSTFPLGTYKIVETSVPKDASGTETGLKLSTTTYYVVISETSNIVADNATRKQIYVGNTLVYDAIAGSAPTVRNENYIKGSSIVDNVEVSVEEHESWYPIGVVKVDKTKADGGVTGVGTTPNKNVPQGDATFNGAQYYLYTTKNITNKFFSKSQNKQLYTLQSAGNNLWQVYNANGTPVVITTGNDGFGKTPATLPYADCS